MVSRSSSEQDEQGVYGTRRIGVISDTHGLMRPQALIALKGSEIILHAGDIGKPEILDHLRQVAPIVIAIRGNIDSDAWAEKIPEREVFSVGAISFYMLHDVKELNPNVVTENIRVVISGHSHQPSIHEKDGVLFLNPRSAGPRRFKLPVTVASLLIKGTEVKVNLIELALN
ncbi:MAG: metallophosphoesterase family protein [Pyrinomonadaceae bacterium]